MNKQKENHHNYEPSFNNKHTCFGLDHDRYHVFRKHMGKQHGIQYLVTDNFLPLVGPSVLPKSFPFWLVVPIKVFLSFCYSVYSFKRFATLFLQWNSKVCTKFHTGKTLLTNLTVEPDATSIKQFEINMFFNTSFFALCLSDSLIHLLDFLRWFVSQ